MFVDEIRRAIEASSRIALPAVTALLWRAYGDGQVTEAEAEALSGLIEARTVSAPPWRANAPHEGISGPPVTVGFSDSALNRPGAPRRPGTGSQPRTDASMERRRRWAASGRLPPGIASKFTLAEQAVLALVAAETVRRGDCQLAIGHLAAIAGLSETTVRNAIREARRLGLVTVEERRVTGFRNLPNVVRIISPEWAAWLRLARKGGPQSGQPSLPKGGGCKSPKRTHTQVLKQERTRRAAPSQGASATSNPTSRQAAWVAGA